MKREMISFLASIENEIKDLCKYIYSNPEVSYKEVNSCNYLCNLLYKHNFKVSKKYLNIDNSFYASKGNSYPKICFL